MYILYEHMSLLQMWHHCTLWHHRLLNGNDSQCQPSYTFQIYHTSLHFLCVL